MLCSLANPHYLHDLSSCGYLEPDSPFLNFVDYLGYWEKPEYAKYILYVPSCAFMRPERALTFVCSCCLVVGRYPQALHHRRLLLQPEFRLQLKIQGATLVQKLADVQFQHWKTWCVPLPSCRFSGRWTAS